LEQLAEDHERGRHDRSAILWLVLVFQTFLEHLAEPSKQTALIDG